MTPFHQTRRIILDKISRSIHEEAGLLEECDCCHNPIGLSDAKWVGTQILCPKCREDNKPKK